MVSAEFVLEKWLKKGRFPELKKPRGNNMDPIADLLSQIKNALAVKKPLISAPFSNFKEAIIQLLIKLGYLKSVSRVGRGPKKFLKVELRYDENGEPLIKEIKKISKPGQRIYFSKKEIKPVKSGFGHLIVSTPEGLMTDKEARKKGLGGEVIFEIF